MELWLSAVMIVIIALLIDRFIGEMPNKYHLLRWIGNLVDLLDKSIRERNSKLTKMIGFISYLIVFLIFWFIMMLACGLIRNGLDGHSWIFYDISMTLGEIIWIFAVAFMFKITFAIYSFRKHCRPIQKDLRDKDIEAARGKVQMIVSRDTRNMDEEHIASSCCETISENLVDSVISPSFYFGFLGLTGAIMFRCANLMDAMWGYLNDRYGKLGFFVAKFDDALGYLTSRISPAFVALTAWIFGYNSNGIFKAAREEHSKTPSPNSGWPMVSVAAAMDISMEKKEVYVMGKGQLPSIKDITRCYKLVERTSLLFILIVTLPFFAIIGIHVQVIIEDAIFDMVRMLI